MKKSLAIVLACVSHMAVANEKYDGIFQLGFESGGDDVFVATFADNSTESISSGGGVVFEGGVAIKHSEKQETRILAGIIYDSIDATNGEASLVAPTLKAMYFTKVSPKVSIGGGVSLHFFPEYSSSGAAGDGNVKYKTALGPVFQVDYNFTPKVAVGLRFTMMDYKTKEGRYRGYEVDKGVSSSANSIGLMLNARF